MNDSEHDAVLAATLREALAQDPAVARRLAATALRGSRPPRRRGAPSVWAATAGALAALALGLWLSARMPRSVPFGEGGSETPALLCNQGGVLTVRGPRTGVIVRGGVARAHRPETELFILLGGTS
jgi:hypothetical protein